MSDQIGRGGPQTREGKREQRDMLLILLFFIVFFILLCALLPNFINLHSPSDELPLSLHSSREADYSRDHEFFINPRVSLRILRDIFIDQGLDETEINSRLGTLTAVLLSPVPTATGTLSVENTPVPAPTQTPLPTLLLPETVAPTAIIPPTPVSTKIVKPPVTPPPPAPNLKLTLSLATFVDHDASGTITLNDDLRYQIQVDNAGNATLSNILVRDITFNIPVTCTATSLSAGASMLCMLDSPHTVTLAEANAGRVTLSVFASGDYGGKSYTQTTSLNIAITQNPAIQLVKSLLSFDDNDSSGTITQGDGLWYGLELTNSGNVTISNLSVTDDTFSLPVACPPVSLAPGNSVNCNTTAAHIVSAAEVSAGEVSNTATASVSFGAVTYMERDTLVIPLSVQLVKSLARYDDNDTSGMITFGDSLWYQFEVTNIGIFALSSISVTDSTFGISVTCPSTSLAAGAAMTCTADSPHTVTLAEANTGNVSNAASVTGQPPAGPVVMDTDSVDTPITRDAALSISKNANPLSYNAIGQVITYNFVVTNAGNVTISGPITVDDDKAADESCPVGNINPGNSITCTASYTITQTDLDSGSVTNSAFATGAGPGGNPVPSAPDTVTVIATQSPSIQIVKMMASYGDLDGSNSITLGDELWYRFNVSNTGNVRLNPVSVTDDSFGLPVTCPQSTLAPGASMLCTADAAHAVTVAEANAGQVVNTATAIGELNGLPYTSSDTITTPVSQSAGIQLVKSLQGYADNDSSGSITLNDDLLYQFTVTNRGNVSLGNLAVTDDTFGIPVNCPVATLDPATSTTCTALTTHTVSLAEADSGQIVNSATASGEFNTVAYTSIDTLTTSIQQTPALTLTKSANPLTFASVGQIITYSYTVRNSGNITLAGPFSITDDKTGTIDPCGSGPLAPGATTSCTAAYAITQYDLDFGSVTNSASAHTVFSGSPVASNPDSATATAIQSPSYTIFKSVTDVGGDGSGGHANQSGDVISYQITLSNTGNVSLIGPSASDPLLGALTGPVESGTTDGILAVGETWTYTGTYTVTQADIETNGGGDGDIDNTVSATTTFMPTPQTASAAVPVDQNPALTLTKSANLGSYDTVGQVITYIYTIENSGNITLAGPFTVDDDRQGTLTNCANGPLAPLATTTCTSAHTVTQADIDAGSITNTATVSGNSVTSAPDSVTINANQTPALTLTKSADLASYDTVGQVITYTYTIENSGNVTLAGPFTVNDDKQGALTACAAGPLAPAGTTTCTSAHTITQADIDSGSITNTAIVTGNSVTSPADILTINAIQNPIIQVVKSSTTTDVTAAGQVVPYSFMVTNIGNITLSGITVSDPNCDAVPAYQSGDTNTNDLLELSETWIYSCSRTTTQAEMDTGGNLSNTVIADSNESAADTDTLDIPITQSPAMTVAKTSVTASLSTPGTVTYDYLVSNIGNVTLTDISLADDNDNDDMNCPATTLAVGTNMSCTATHTFTRAELDAGGSLTNNVTASSNEASDALDSLSIPIIQTPAIQVVKSSTTTDVNSAGQVVPFSFSVTNVGNITLSSITISDPNCDVAPAYQSGDTNTDSLLDLSETWTYACSHTVTQAEMDAGGNLSNTVTVDSSESGPGTATVAIPITQSPALSLTKSANLATYDSLGQVITYTYTIENSGNVTLAGPFTVTDDKQGMLTDCATGPLAPLATTTCTSAHTVTQADLDAGSLTNNATVSGNSVISAPDSVTANAVQIPELSLQKSLASYTDNDSSASISQGDSLWYQFEVTNIGNVTLTNVSVTDNSFTIPVTCPSSTLAPGTSMTCTADSAYTVSPADAAAGTVSNEATVQGNLGVALYTTNDILNTTVVIFGGAFISGQVRDDTDGDGDLGDKDTGLANVKVELDNGACILGSTCVSDLTDTNGNFFFSGILDGAYILIENDPLGYLSTADSDPPNDNQIDVIITGGTSSPGNIFLDTANPGSCTAPDPVNGYVVSTNPANGATNVPVSLTTITVTFSQPMITSGGDSVLNPDKYELKNQANGNKVTITTVTYDPQTKTATLNLDTSDPDWQAGKLFNLTIKNIRNACGTAQPDVVRSFTTELEISGQVRNNLDSKGIYGVTVTLTGGSCAGSCITTTDLNGNFRFLGYAPGSYTLTETDLPGYSSVSDSDGGSANQVSLTLVAGSNSTGHYFIDTPSTCTAPSVASSNPTNGQTGVLLSTNTITVTFNRPMRTEGGGSVLDKGNFDNNIDNLTLGGDVPILGVSYDPNTYTATLTIDTTDPQWQSGSQFQLKVEGGLENSCGTKLGTDVIILFSTEAFISGQVRNSLDNQGIYGVTIGLTGGSCSGSCTTTTDLNGNFTFIGFAPGSYTLLETNLPGYTGSVDSSPPNNDLIPFTLAGGNSTGHIFVDTPSCIGGANFVASTIPVNGTTGISLNTTTLTITFNQPMITYGGGSVLDKGNFDNNIDNLTLGGEVNIVSASYNPNTYTATLTLDTSDNDWLPGSQYRLRIKNGIKNACDVKPTGADVDVLFTTDLVISGQVRDDLDNDGNLSDLDPGIASVTVRLYNSSNTLVGTTTTNSGGFFTFSNLSPGTYYIRETDPSNYISTADSFGANDNEITVTLSAGANSIGHRFLDYSNLPGISIADLSGFEKDNGVTTYQFVVSLSKTSASTITVDFATSNGSATGGANCSAGVDFRNNSNVITFLPGDSTKNANITVCTDTDAESDEIFTLVLSNPTNAFISKNTGTGIIFDDDSPGFSTGHFVKSIMPADLTANVNRSTDIIIEFNRDMCESTVVDPNNIRLFPVSGGPDVVGTRSYSAGTKTVTFAPSILLSANTEYQIMVRFTKTLVDGCSLSSAPYSQTFTTGN